MLRECIEIFTKEYERNNKLIIDSYELEVGEYIIVRDLEKNYTEQQKIIIDKKTDKKIIENYDDLAERDYLSKLLDMNKPIDGKKKIHSNNYLTFFIKKDVLIAKEKEILESINSYYDTLKNPLLKYNKGEKKKAYEILEKNIGKVDGEKVDKIKNWILKNLPIIREEIQSNPKSTKEYLKIFFYDSSEKVREEYNRENKRYVIPNIYNSVDFNVDIDGVTYGFPNNNLNLNSKKPYLELKSRKKKYTVPYLLNEEEVFIQKKFFDYLYNLANAKKRNVYFSNLENKIITLQNDNVLDWKFNGYYLRIRKDKSEAAIEKFTNIPRFENIIKLPIKILDYTDRENSEKESILTYGQELKSIKNLVAILNVLVFNKKLFTIIHEEVKTWKINDENIKYFCSLYKDILFNLVIKGDIESFLEIYRNLFITCILDNLKNAGYLGRVREIYNFMLSIKDSLEIKKEGFTLNKVEEIRCKLKEQLKNEGNGVLENDEQFFYAAGQLFRFLISKSQETVRTHNLFSQLMRTKSICKIKEELKKLFIKYGYSIGINDNRFNKLYAMVAGYELNIETAENSENENILICGYLSNLLTYEKSEK